MSSQDQVLKNIKTAFTESNFGINIVYFVTSIISLVALVSILLSINISPISSVFLLNYITDNINTPPLNDIQFQEGPMCAENFTKTLLGYWPGSKKGTFIDGLIFDFQPTYAKDATLIDPIKPIDLYYWKSQKICTKRIKEFLMIPQERQLDCPNGYKRCSSNLCLSESEVCPLTSITIQRRSQFNSSSSKNDNSQQLPQNQEQKVSLGVNQEAFTGSLEFNKVRDFSEAPIFGLQISFNGLPCYSNDSSAYIDNSYILIDRNNGCGRFGQDPGSKQIDSSSEIDFYIGNGITQTLEKLPTYMHTLQGNKVYLVQRSKMELASFICIQNLQENEVKLSSSHIFKFKTFNYAPIIMLTIEIGISLYTLLTLFFVLIAKNENRVKLLQNLNIIISVVSILFEIAFLSVINFILSEQVENVLIEGKYYSEIAELGCFTDVNMAKGIQEYNHFVQTSFGGITSDSVHLTYILFTRLIVIALSISAFGFQSSVVGIS